MMKVFLSFFIFSCLLFNGGLVAQTAVEQKLIAVTVDDLLINGPGKDTDVIEEMTLQLLRKLNANKITAVGFVNERQLSTNSEDDRRTSILNLWLEHGMELGNHTYSHVSMHDVPLKEYEENILKGEVVTNKLLAKQNKKARYFRHPYLRTGESLETKKEFDKFLAEHGYTIAPVTIENSDWYFSNIYRRAKANSDSATMKIVVDSYLQFTKDVIEYGELLSEKLFRRQIKHVFLIHANELNADCIEQIAEIIKSYNYGFTTLEDALTDEAYKLPDNFVGKYGPIWTQRWALDKGMKDIVKLEPEIPGSIVELYDSYK